MPSRTELLHEAEFRRCRADAEYFFSKYWKIQTPSGAQPFELREPQRTALLTWTTERYVLNLKARQIGWTTLAAGYAFWKAFFNEDQAIIFLSKGEREAVEILKKVDYGYRRLPVWMQERGPKRLSFAQTKMPFDNGSEIESLPSKEDPARGRTVNVVIVDEWAFLENPEDAWASIEPISDIGGQIIGLSTANGWGNFFHELWVKASTGNSSFVPLFFPWNAVPERDSEWYERKRRDLQEWQLHQEYPSDPDEAFIKSGNTVFDIDALRGMAVAAPREGYVTEGAGFFTFVEQRNGQLHLWEVPALDDGYVIGADVAEGLEHGDFSSAHVISMRTNRVVAHWHGHIDPDLFGEEILYRLGRYYNRAFIGVEANNHGIATLNGLKRKNYPNLFHRYVEDERTRRRTKKLGWYTSRTSKAQVIDGLVKALREGLQVPDEHTLAELKTYVRDEKGGMNGSPFDDRVMSLAISAHMLSFASMPSFEIERNDYGTFAWWLRQADEAENERKAESPLGAHNARRSLAV